jgi:hypothetical protein
MSTFTILAGFALMLFLPCAVAMLGSRDNSDSTAYSDRNIDPIARLRIAQPIKPPAEVATVQTQPEKEDTKPVVQTPEAITQKEVVDPTIPNRVQKTHQARILRNEMEALMASAAAARAQADALAANARLAAAKAEAADAEATAAEAAAAEAIQEMRRAA